MLKKLLLAVAMLIATMGFAFAQVDVNKADQTALDGIKGIGPKMSKAILDERKKGGDFKDWADFQARVTGVGEKNSVKLSQAGLTINGRAKEGAPAQEAKGVTGKAVVKPAQAAGSDSSEAKAKPGKLEKITQAAGSDSSPPEKLQSKASASAQSKASASAAASAQRK